MKSWQHRTDILDVCSVWKQSAVIGKPVRHSFTVKLCRVGCACGYDLFMDRFQSCVELNTSWDCRTEREDICGQRVAICGQRMDGREDRINITIASCLIGVTFTFSYISRYAYYRNWNLPSCHDQVLLVLNEFHSHKKTECWILKFNSKATWECPQVPG